MFIVWLGLSEVEKESENLQQKSETIKQVPEQPIPEGFFDDPILDAKVFNIYF